MLAGYSLDDRIWCDFDEAGRVWYVTPSFFSELRENLLRDPQWAERNFLKQFGPGPVTVAVTHKVNDSIGRVPGSWVTR